MAQCWPAVPTTGKNRFEDGYWTYHLDDVWAGIQDAYARLAADYKAKYGEELRQVGR